MKTETNAWTDEARGYLEGYLQQVGALLAGKAVDAQEVVNDLRDHVIQLAATNAGSLVTLPDVKRLLATVGTPDEVAISWAELGSEPEEKDPWAPTYLNVPPPTPEQRDFRPWIVGAAVVVFLLPIAYFLFRGGGETAPNEGAAPVSSGHPVVGAWHSVDFIANVENFRPGVKSWQGDLYLKDLSFFAGGQTSLKWTWTDGWITDPDSGIRAEYFIKDLDGDPYLFLPWLSGDVTIRGMEPKYYVLAKGPGSPDAAASQPAPSPVSPAQPAREPVGPPAGEQASGDDGELANLTGEWTSVDFVSQVNDFTPGTPRTRRTDLFLKDLTCNADGTTSLGYTWWANGWVLGNDGQTRAEYEVKTINGNTYLFLPWLSGDVTIRGEAPKYYVLKKVSGAAASGASSAPQNTGIATGGNLTGTWQSVDFVSTVDEFSPGDRKWKGDFFLKSLQCNASGGTSIGYGWWANGRMVGQDGRTQATFYTLQANGNTYLFLPWLSGDVTIRGMAPKYYVMRKTG